MSRSLTMLAVLVVFPVALRGQSDGMGSHAHEHGGMEASATNMRYHMAMTPSRAATHADSVRAREVVAALRRGIARYADTAAAVADGYRMFLPEVKEQPVYHFTSTRRGFAEAFRFAPEKPTSLLYRRKADGRLELVGAMYTAPRRMVVEKLDARVPLGIARWHRHVNWCMPPTGARARWRETRDGHPVFGPASPIASRAACEAVGGQFHENVFGWMLHANVFQADDLGTIFGDEHR